MIPFVALCFHRPSVAELTVSMAELFAVVEGIGDRIMLQYYLSPLPAHAALREAFSCVKTAPALIVKRFLNEQPSRHLLRALVHIWSRVMSHRIRRVRAESDVCLPNRLEY